MKEVYAAGECLTGDIRKLTASDKPASSCSDFTDALVEVLSK